MATRKLKIMERQPNGALGASCAINVASPKRSVPCNGRSASLPAAAGVALRLSTDVIEELGSVSARWNAKHRPDVVGRWEHFVITVRFVQRVKEGRTDLVKRDLRRRPELAKCWCARCHHASVCIAMGCAATMTHHHLAPPCRSSPTPSAAVIAACRCSCLQSSMSIPPLCGSFSSTAPTHLSGANLNPNPNSNP